MKNFSAIAKPLHKLTECSRQFSWTKECEDAFALLKQHLTSSPVLVFPDYTKTFILDTDASNEGIGAVLLQVHDEQERVVAFASRTLSKAERKYCVTRKELLCSFNSLGHISWDVHFNSVQTTAL